MDKKGLTVKQKKLYDFIRMCIKEKEVSPSYEEMMVGVSVKSKRSIKRLLDCLKDRGYIDYIPRKARSIVLMEDVGKVELNELRDVKAAARLYFNAKSAWDNLYTEDPEHPDNQQVHAPRVFRTHKELERLVMGD